MTYNFSKKVKMEYILEMNRINKFCLDNGIQKSKNNDSYYFVINNQEYRVSNHSVESRVEWNDNLELVKKANSIKENSVIYITAGKTRIIEIYNNLLAGKKLDKRGNIIC